MMTKTTKLLMAIGLVIASMTSLQSVAQPRYDMSKLNREKLNRGVVAVPMADGAARLTFRPFEIKTIKCTRS